MSSSFGSGADEFGTGNIKVPFRRMSDIADDKGDYFLMKENVQTIVRLTEIFQDKPLFLRADQNYQFEGTTPFWFYTGTTGPVIGSFPLKSGDITGFSDGTTNTIVTTSSDHDLKIGDVVRIIDSRIEDYLGLFAIVTVPTSTTFTIDVTFNTADGQSRFIQRQINFTAMAESSNSETITSISLVLGGSDYVDSETLTITGQSSAAVNGTATVNGVIDGIISTLSLVDAGTGYSVENDTELDGGNGGGATIDITAVGGSGQITAFSLNEPGIDYQVNDILVVASGNEDATLEVDSIIDGRIVGLVLVLAGSSYTDGETVTLTGASSSDATATIEVSVAKTTITMADHMLDDDLSINITESTNSTDGNFVISNVTDDTVDIEFTFVSTGTGLVDVGTGGFSFTNESILNASFPNMIRFFDLESTALTLLSGMALRFTNLFFFELGESRGQNIISFSETAIQNCDTFHVLGNSTFSAISTPVLNLSPPSLTNNLGACFRIGSGEGGDVSLVSSLPTLQENQSYVEIPPLVNTTLNALVTDSTSADPGTLFSLGYTTFSTTSAITSANGGAEIVIPLDDTIRFRIGDEIEILDSTSYTAGVTGNIVSSGIIKDTSIQVDIAFVAGDTEIIIRDNTLKGKDGTDPQVFSSGNVSEPDSTITANVILPFDANLTVNIVDAATPVAIGGTWTFTKLERITVNTSGGIATYIGSIERKVLVLFGASVTGAASALFAIQIFKNGINITDTPPLFDIANASSAVSNTSSQVVTMAENDTLQMFISNPTGTSDPSVRAAHMTITQI